MHVLGGGCAEGYRRPWGSAGPDRAGSAKGRRAPESAGEDYELRCGADGVYCLQADEPCKGSGDAAGERV